MLNDEAEISGDKLRGAEAIAAFIDEPLRRTVYLLETGQIPAGKLGRCWLASKSVLRKHYQKITGAGDAAA